MRIVIDGSIGSGKTTLLKKLSEIGYNVKYEAIDEWPLEEFYKDPERWTLALQLSIIKSMELPSDGTIHERCIQTSNRVFFRLIRDSYNISDIDAQLYEYFYNKHVWIPDKHIYLKASPEKCFQNIQKRTQTGDSFVSLEYLKKLDSYYERFIQENPSILIVDAECDIETVFKNVCSLIV